MPLRLSFLTAGRDFKSTDEEITKRVSLDHKNFKRIMVERQGHSARVRNPQKAFETANHTNPGLNSEVDIGGDSYQGLLDDINENVISSERMSDRHRDKLRENISSLNNKHEKFKLMPSFSNHLRNKFLSSERTNTLNLNESKFDERSCGSFTARSLQEAKCKYSSKVKRSIPCLSFSLRPDQRSTESEKAKNMADKLVLYFHGNGEDLSQIKDLAEYMCKTLNTSVLCVEYPGYSVYHGIPNETQMLEDAEAVYSFAREELSINPADLVVVGRSLGSGPAVHLASKYTVFGTVLISPFSSIKEVIKEKVGTILANCVKQRFDNLSKIGLVRGRLKIVHGEKDDVVNVEQSRALAGMLWLPRKVRRHPLPHAAARDVAPAGQPRAAAAPAHLQHLPKIDGLSVLNF